MHPVGSYYTYISRCTVNKTLNLIPHLLTEHQLRALILIPLLSISFLHTPQANFRWRSWRMFLGSYRHFPRVWCLLSLSRNIEAVSSWGNRKLRVVCDNNRNAEGRDRTLCDRRPPSWSISLCSAHKRHSCYSGPSPFLYIRSFRGAPHEIQRAEIQWYLG